MRHDPIILTEKGQRWMLAAYRTAVTIAAVAAFIALLGFAGWLEGL